MCNVLLVLCSCTKIGSRYLLTKTLNITIDREVEIIPLNFDFTCYQVDIEKEKLFEV